MNQIELIAAVAETVHDPLLFVLFAFDWGAGELALHDGPDEWQREILTELGDALKRGVSVVDAVTLAIQMAVCSGHGIGKSALVSWIILWAISTFEDTRGIVTANTITQLKTKTWAELAKWHRLCITASWFEFTATAIYSRDPQHEKTWRVDMVPWSMQNVDAFAGLHNQGRRILMIFDEASGIPDKIWEVAEGALTDANTEIIWCVFGNPTNSFGRFRECFRRFRRWWRTWQIDSRNVKITNKQQIQLLVDQHGEDSDVIKIRVRGVFPDRSAKQFISAEIVDRAITVVLQPHEYNFAPVIIACDPAWEGDDMLTIGMRQGLYTKELACIPKNDNDFEIAGILARFEDEYKAQAVFIDMGYGTGIFSGGKMLGRKWNLINFAGKSSDPGFLNARAKMWNDMREWLRDGGSIPDDTDLYAQLTAPETVARLDGKIQLESKVEIKKRIGMSTDKADWIALTFAHPVLIDAGRIIAAPTRRIF